jgi:hypothetical protein
VAGPGGNPAVVTVVQGGRQWAILGMSDVGEPIDIRTGAHLSAFGAAACLP